MAFFDSEKAFTPKSLQDPDEILNKAIHQGRASLSAKELAILDAAYPDVLKAEETPEPYYKEGKYH